MMSTSTASAVMPLHHLQACTSLIDLSTPELQSRLSSLVSSVTSPSTNDSASPPMTLDDFTLIEREILIIHQELRERHLSAALEKDPWMDSELDDVHVGQREIQVQEKEQQMMTANNTTQNIVAPAAPPSAAEQQWMNRQSDRRSLDDMRKRKSEPLRIPNKSPSPASSLTSNHKLKSTNSTSKSSSASSSATATKSSSSSSSSSTSSIPESILNQRREMVISTSSVDNRKMNRKKSSTTPASPSPSSPLSTSSSKSSLISRDSSQSSLSSTSSSSVKRSSSSKNKMNGKSKVPLSANEKMKRYAQAQKDAQKEASDAATKDASSTTGSTSHVDDQSIASTTVASPSPSPLPASDDAITNDEVEEEFELDPTYENEIDDDDDDDHDNHSPSTTSDRTPPAAYASMDHSAIEAVYRDMKSDASPPPTTTSNSIITHPPPHPSATTTAALPSPSSSSKQLTTSKIPSSQRFEPPPAYSHHVRPSSLSPRFDIPSSSSSSVVAPPQVKSLELDVQPMPRDDEDYGIPDESELEEENVDENEHMNENESIQPESSRSNVSNSTAASSTTPNATSTTASNKSFSTSSKRASSTSSSTPLKRGKNSSSSSSSSSSFASSTAASSSSSSSAYQPHIPYSAYSAPIMSQTNKKQYSGAYGAGPSVILPPTITLKEGKKGSSSNDSKRPPYQLILGSKLDALNLDLLLSLNVKLIINLIPGIIGQLFPDKFTYHCYEIEDLETETIEHLFDECADLIVAQLKNTNTQTRGAILVHCAGGISRSTSIVLAYLIREYRWSYEEAFKYVQSCRKRVRPNEGFVRQLREYEVKCRLREMGLNGEDESTPKRSKSSATKSHDTSSSSSSAASASSSTSAVEQARARVARANPRKEAEAAVARISKAKERTVVATVVPEKEPGKTSARSTASKDPATVSTSSSGSDPSSSPTALIIPLPPKPKKSPRPLLSTHAYDTILPSLEYMFAAMWSAASASAVGGGGNAAASSTSNGTIVSAPNQSWFAALVQQIAQCEKFKMVFGGYSLHNGRVMNGGSSNASSNDDHQLRLDYLPSSLTSSNGASSTKHKLTSSEARVVEQTKLMKAQRALLTGSDDSAAAAPSPSPDPSTSPSPDAASEDPEDDHVLARDHGPLGNSAAMIFLVTREREEVYNVVREALLELKDDDDDDHTSSRAARTWIECPVEDTPKPDRLFPFLPPNFTSAAIGTTPVGVLPSPAQSSPPPAWTQPPSVVAREKEQAATQQQQSPIEFSSTTGQFHDRTSTTPSLYWNLLWTWKKPHIDYTKLFCWQKINHFPDSRCLTRKDLLKKQLDRYSTHKGWKYAHEWRIMPQSFILPQEYQQFIEAFAKNQVMMQQQQQQEKSGDTSSSSPLPTHNFWICKPPSLSRGRGIYITSQLEEINYKDPLIIQHYITNPLLLNGYKFDLRLYVVVSSIQPLEVFLYKEGFARISTSQWSSSEKDLKNRFIHLTNSSVQKNNILGKDGKEIGGAGSEGREQAASASVNRTGDVRFDAPAGGGIPNASRGKATLTDSIFNDPLGDGGSKISLAHLWRHLQSLGLNTDELWSSIIRVVLKTVIAAEDDITPNVNSFELFGFDLLITDRLDVHLIEVNASPSMGLETPLDRVIKPRLIRDIVNLIAPMSIHRYYLQKVMERRFHTSHFERHQPKTREKKVKEMNEILHHALLHEKPRLVGELPQKLGLFERIAPLTSHFDALVKMKRTAFQPTTNPEHKHKRTLPNMV